MEKVIKQVEFPKEWSEVGDALVEIAKAVKLAKADGWQAGQDVPVVLLASFQPLAKALDGVMMLEGEAKEAPEGAIKAMACAGADVYAVLK